MIGRASIAFALVVLVGCDKPHASSTSAPSAVASDDAPPARRPTKRWYLENVNAKCATFSVDGEVTTARKQTPCPPDLEPGERLRIAGKTCMRESSEKTRQEPAVCPDPLTNEEKKDLASQGKGQ